MNNINININNYEEFALDYLENNLSEEARTAFDLFLSSHPEVSEEVSGLLDYSLKADTFVYDNKDGLRHKSPAMFGLNGRILILVALLFALVTAFLLNTKTSKNLSSTYDDDQVIKLIANESSSPETKHEQNIAPLDAEAASKNKLITQKQQTESISSVPSKTHKNQSTTQQSTDQIRGGKVETGTVKQKNRAADSPILNQKSAVQDERILNPLQDPIKVKAGEKPIARMEDDVEQQMNQDTTNIIIAKNDTKVSNEALDRTAIAIDKVEQASIAFIESNPNDINADLANRIPDITIDIETETNDEDIIAMAHLPTKKKKFSFRNFLPEQFAGITKEDIKRSLLPENLTSR